MNKTYLLNIFVKNEFLSKIKQNDHKLAFLSPKIT